MKDDVKSNRPRNAITAKTLTDLDSFAYVPIHTTGIFSVGAEDRSLALPNLFDQGHLSLHDLFHPDAETGIAILKPLKYVVWKIPNTPASIPISKSHRSEFDISDPTDRTLCHVVLSAAGRGTCRCTFFGPFLLICCFGPAQVE